MESSMTTMKIRMAMHYEFKLKNSAYGNNIVCKRTVQRWYQKFNSGDESLENELRGRPASMIEDNVLNTCIEEDTSQTSRELEERIGVSHRYFKTSPCLWESAEDGQMGSSRTVRKNKFDRLSACSAHVIRHRNVCFPDRIVTCDEK